MTIQYTKLILHLTPINATVPRINFKPDQCNKGGFLNYYNIIIRHY